MYRNVRDVRIPGLTHCAHEAEHHFSLCPLHHNIQGLQREHSPEVLCHDWFRSGPDTQLEPHSGHSGFRSTRWMCADAGSVSPAEV